MVPDTLRNTISRLEGGVRNRCMAPLFGMFDALCVLQSL
jgi:hypothetical protein